MRRTLFVPFVLAALTGSIAARAQDHDMMGHHMHMAAMATDSRQPLDFPPEMRQHLLGNMRDHLQAVSDILAAMSGADYAKASQIADARLGMESPEAGDLR